MSAGNEREFIDYLEAMKRAEEREKEEEEEEEEEKSESPYHDEDSDEVYRP